jgi:2-iminobutanoate/2-iminopropanoate deaminase
MMLAAPRHSLLARKKMSVASYILRLFYGMLSGMEIKRINTPNAPQPAGHYSQATVHNGLVFVAGQLSVDPNGEKKLGPIEEQSELALNNVHAILKAAGSDWDRVLKMNISIADIGLWDAFNKVYARVLGDNRPARAVIPCGPLHHGFLIEIEAIAATDL